MQTSLCYRAALSLRIGSLSLTLTTVYAAEQPPIPRYPDRIPPVLVDRLNSDIVTLSGMRDVRERLANERKSLRPARRQSSVHSCAAIWRNGRR